MVLNFIFLNKKPISYFKDFKRIPSNRYRNLQMNLTFNLAPTNACFKAISYVISFSKRIHTISSQLLLKNARENNFTWTVRFMLGQEEEKYNDGKNKVRAEKWNEV